jgi:hypothetical protein
MHDEKIGFQILVSRVPLTGDATDTFTVPTLANTTNNASSAQVRIANEAAVTVTDDGSNTVTLAGGVKGAFATIVTIHGPGVLNYGAEA